MNLKSSYCGVATVASLVVLGTGPVAAFASAPATYSVPSPAQLSALSPSEAALFASGAPQVIVMDPTTGDILSVTPAAASPDISRHSICNAGDGCYETNQPPEADEGFYGGSGTSTGNWPYRSGYSAGKWSVSACWGSKCGVEIGPGSTVEFTSDVTGTSFTIH